MPRMNLDVKDRLILSNQYRILEALYPQDAELFSRARKVVEDGYELYYDSIAEYIDSKPLSENTCRYVVDVLSMYRDLKSSYDKLDDKSGMDPHAIEFMGFDGNNESRLLGFARHIIIDEEGFQELRNAGDRLNSHMPTSEIYRRMLDTWLPLRDKFPLSKADIQAIANARIHPSHRTVPSN